MKFRINQAVIAGGIMLPVGSIVDSCDVSSQTLSDLSRLVEIPLSGVDDMLTREDSTAPVVKPAPKPARGGPKPSMASEPGTRPRT